jgi:hypothetical protein
MICKKASRNCSSVKERELEALNSQLMVVAGIKTTDKLVFDSLEWVANPVFD